MIKGKNILYGTLIGAVLLAAILVALQYFLPVLMNSESVKGRIQDEIGRLTGGKATIHDVALSLLPLPHAEVREGALSVPETVTVTLESIRVYPKLLPLLTGTLEVSAVQVNSPDIKVILPALPTERSEKETSKKHILDAAKKQLSLLMASLASHAPDLVVEVKKGTLDLLAGENPLFSFQNIDLRIVFPPAGLKVDLACSSNVWEKLTVHIVLDPEDFGGNGEVNVVDFKPETIRAHLFPDADSHVVESIRDLKASVETEGFRSVNAAVDAVNIHSVHQRPHETLDIQVRSLKALLNIDSEKAKVALTELQLDYPQANLSGELSLDRKGQHVSLELKGEEVDVHSARETALALAGKYSVTEKIFTILRGGRVPEINFTSHGTTMKDLGKTDNFIIAGRMVNGIIHVPGIDLPLDRVKGEVVISEGVLKGKGLEGQTESERGRDGTLSIGLKGGDAPFHLDLHISSNLSHLPLLLKGILKHEGVMNEINSIRNMKGSAEGRLVVGESLKSVKARVDVSEVDLSAEHERLPYPLKLAGGQFSYEASEISINNMNLGLGKSSLSGLRARLQLGKDYDLQVRSGKGRVIMDEIYPWLSSFEIIGSALKEVPSVNGVLGITSLKLEGPLLKPGDWDYEGKGDVTSAEINTTLFPDPVEVTKGKYGITRGKLLLTDNQMNILDASFYVSGSIRRYREGLHNADLTFRGKMGPGATKRLSDVINLPSQLRVRSPLSVSQAHLVLDKDTGTSMKANITVRKGPDITIDLVMDPERFSLNNMTIQNDESRAAASLVLTEKELGFTFSGNVTGKTLDDIFLTSLVQQEWIKGNFEARILKDEPIKSSARGKLKGKNILFPWKLKAPLTINSLELNGSGSQVNVQSADLTLGNSHFLTNGNIEFLKDNFFVDMNVSSEGVDWETVSKIFQSEEDDKKRERFWDVPVRGTVDVQSQYLSYGRFRWEPFNAGISFSRDKAMVNITDADLCGIAFPGSLDITPGNIKVDFDVKAGRQELDSAFTCLFGIRRYSSGTFDLNGTVTGDGKGELLADSIQGNADFYAENGRIYQYGVTAKVFAFLNLTEIFRGNLPDLVKEGFAYKTIKAKADLMGTTLYLKEFVIDGSSMEIVSQGDIHFKEKTLDLQVLVAPLKTVDSITRMIPIIKDITGGSLVTIPLKVTGGFDTIQVNYMPASGVGSGLMGIMKNTLKAPVQIFLPHEKK